LAPLSILLNYGVFGYIPSVMAALEMYSRQIMIYFFPGLGEVFAGGGHSQHSPAIGEDFTPVANFSASVKYNHVFIEVI
jgi:hypothetical protein